MYYEFHTEPYKHQIKTLKMALKKGNLGVLADPGCGKTKIAIDYIGCRYLRDGHKRILVLAPKSVLGVWEEEIETHLPPSIPRAVIRLEGTNRERLIKNHMNPDKLTIFLISYDSAWRSKGSLIKWKSQGVIADESHYIAGATSKRSRGARAIREHADWALILTGTFLPNWPLNAYAQLNFLNPKIFPYSWTKFKNRYAVWVMAKGGYWRLKRYKRLHELKEIIRKYSVVIKKDKVLDLPKRQDSVVPIDMDPKTRKIYDQIKKEKLVEFKQGKATAEIILTELLRFQQLTSGFLSVETGRYDHRDRPIREEVKIHEAKIKAALEIIDIHRAHGEKVVVFTRFRWELDQIATALRKRKISCAVIDGRVNVKERDEIRRDFQKGKYDVAVVNMATGGVGINLTAANVAIFFSLSFKYDHYQQAKDRIHRPGQNKPVIYYHLIMRKSIDEKIMTALREKKSLADKLTEQKPEELV